MLLFQACVCPSFMLTYRANEIDKGFALGSRTSLLTGEALHTTSLSPTIALRKVIGERFL